MFGSATILRVLEEYSSAAWLEKAEELSVQYAQQEVNSIKKALLGFSQHFKVSQFEDQCQRKAARDTHLQQFSTKFPAVRVLEDLYRVGVLGQSTSEKSAKGKSFIQHWAYRGDNNFDPSAWCIVHKSLWPELRLGKIGTN